MVGPESTGWSGPPSRRSGPPSCRSGPPSCRSGAPSRRSGAPSRWTPTRSRRSQSAHVFDINDLRPSAENKAPTALRRGRGWSKRDTPPEMGREGRRAGFPACRFWGLSSPQNEHRAGKPGEPAGWNACPTARPRRSADISVGVSGRGFNHAGKNAGAPRRGSWRRRAWPRPPGAGRRCSKFRVRGSRFKAGELLNLEL